MVYLPPDPAGWRFRRSMLFMPASNLRAIAKVPSLDCDGVILDLEDAVGESDRQAARRNLVEVVAPAGFGSRERVIRLGSPSPSLGGDEFAADLEAALACEPDALLLPKVETPQAIHETAMLLDAAGSAARIWVMIETPRALVDLAAIASAGQRLECLVVGPNDLARTTGTAMLAGREAMLPWLMQIIAAARAFGLGVLDGVYNRFRDTDGFAAECLQGARMGFDGKTLIHPSQIAAANTAFGPSAGELERARTILAAFERPENAGLGAIQIEGEMIERLHLEQARHLLAMATGLSGGSP